MINYFVFDTNSLISAHLIAGSVSAKAFDKANEFGILVYTKDSFYEFATRFLDKKFDKYLTITQRIKLTKEFERKGQLIEILHSINICRDPDDNECLELAVAVGASCIISGDKDLLVLHPFEGIPILTPGQFLKWCDK
ncbi:MAG: putative toxin-antitoxin system toxin component, PIN family [Mangrovibacterium sp.]